MFKRANKITSLLVAAAAVMSLVPAYAADVKKIDSEDGTVYNAVAYKDGKALIDGEVEDNDGAYYYADGKYTELEDVDSGSDYTTYADKYVNVEDGDYFVDLTSGKVTDDSVDEDDQDDAATALRKKLKDVDRFGDDDSLPKFDATTGVKFGYIPGTKFADTWYVANGYEVKNDDKDADYQTYPNIYTDKDGNYIDADYNLGKIKVETTATAATTNTTATIENSADKEDFYNGGQTSAKVTHAKPLGQDKDYIYRYAEIEIALPADAVGQQVLINNKAFNVDATKLTLPVIQKISKAQNSDDKDDAKYAKTVYNYVLSNDKAELEVKNTIATDDIDDSLVGWVKNDDNIKGSVIGGKFVLYSFDNSIDDADNVTVRAMTLKSKNGYYYTDLEDKTTIQAEHSDDLEKIAADTDVDGNIYVVDGGYVKEFDGTDDWNKIYKVDGSFDALSVYDKDNMISWSQGDEVYSIIGAKTTDETPATPTTPAGWVQAADGTWSFVKADGTKATGWYKDTNGAWYFLKADGVMATGWLKDTDGTWYFLNASGAMATGWVQDGGAWYYLNASGAMLANTTVDGYVLGANGAWVK